MQKTPQRLGKSPLVESLFEIRFESSIPTAGDLFPGLLFPSLRENFPEVEPLPLASVPREIRNRDEFLYQPSHRLKGTSNSVQLGDRVVTVSSQDYGGWSQFKSTIEMIIDRVRQTDLVKQVERYSFRYINIIEAVDEDNQLSLLNLTIAVASQPPNERGFQLRLERDDDGFVTIIRIVPRSEARNESGKKVRGLLLDVDTIKEKFDDDLFSEHSHLLETAHDQVSQIFFSMLSESTLLKMEPVW
ncbi:MAG TPA: TIGR04255 family protein [Pyrinomonadaceae bacterium]|nr:TIGR04255 family protein [Pyrinomonadaceae bacterium]